MNCLQQKKTNGHRSGVVTVMVLVVLILLAGMVTQFVRRAVTDRRQSRQELIYEQTQSLANAGELRLRMRLADDENYAGETWDLPVGTIHQANSAQVQIKRNGAVATITHDTRQMKKLRFR